MKTILLIIVVSGIVILGHMTYKRFSLSKNQRDYYTGIENRINKSINLINQSFDTADYELRERIKKGRCERTLAPGYGFCHRCGRPWKFTKGHSTTFEEGHGCFPLCEDCWSELTPTERLPFYRQLIDGYIHDSKLPSLYTNDTDYEKEWEMIKKAVLKGG